MTNKKKQCRLFSITNIIFIIICIFIFWGLNNIVFSEHRYDDGYDENFVQNYEGYQKLPQNCLDYLCVGSSNVFMNINPLLIYNKYGYYGYNLSCPMQTLQQSFYQMKTALKTQSPKVILLDCLAFQLYSENSEPYAHMNFDAYPLTWEKYKYLKENLSPQYDISSFVFPFLLYHTRYNKLDVSDFDLCNYKQAEDFLGYAPAFSVVPFTGELLSEKHYEAVTTDINRAILEDMLILCKEKNAKLVLIKTPSWSWYHEDSLQMEILAKEYNLDFIEMNSNQDLNYENDFCDGGGHLNNTGTDKNSRFLADKLYEYFGEKIILDEVVENYYKKRYENLKKYIQWQKLKFETNVESYIKQLDSQDYIIGITGNINQYTIKIFDQFSWMDKEMKDSLFDEQKCCILADSKEVLIDCQPDMASIEKKIMGDIFYLENGNNGSYIQVNYHNYSLNKSEFNFDIVVYEKNTRQVIDRVTIGYQSGEPFLLRL